MLLFLSLHRSPMTFIIESQFQNLRLTNVPQLPIVLPDFLHHAMFGHVSLEILTNKDQISTPHPTESLGRNSPHNPQ